MQDTATKIYSCQISFPFCYEQYRNLVRKDDESRPSISFSKYTQCTAWILNVKDYNAWDDYLTNFK
jgi:hypothetical protein